MKYSLILSLFIAVLLTTSCVKEENPLDNHSPEILGKWLFENSNPSISKCAETWSNPKASNATISDCEYTATYLANKMNKAGYGEISSNNILHEPMWSVYNKLMEVRLKEIKKNGMSGAFGKPLK